MRKPSNQFPFCSDNDKQIQSIPLLPSSSSQNKNEESVSEGEDSHAQSQQKVQRRRRTRKDSGAAREYICPCGKNYLSYPALYTHIKQKHNSVPPGEIQKPSNSQSNKNVQNSVTSSASGGSADEAQDSPPSVPSIQTQVIDKNTFLQSIAIPTTGEARKLTREEAESLIAWQIAASYYHTGLNSRISPYYQMLFNQYKSVFRQIGTNESTNNELNFDKLKMNTQDGLKEATINQSLILFLLEVENFLDTLQYSLIGLFSYLLRRAINDIFYGIKVIIFFFLSNIKDQTQDEEACERMHPKDIGEIANFFVSQLIDAYLVQLKPMISSSPFLQELYKIQNLKIPISKLTYFFCNWLYERTLSHHILQLKPAIQMQQ